MMTHFRSAGLVLVGALLLQASAQNALTADNIQTLKNNGYTITVDEESNTIKYEHHGKPNHTSEQGWGNPNDAEKVNHSYTMPLNPTAATDKGCAGTLGVIGLAVNGGAFYNPYTAFGWDAVEGECAEELDSCRGHPSPDGTYHYHGVPDCIYTGDLRDKFLGVALDGFPIYGPMDNTGKNWTSAELDICHGHTYNGRYIYRATYDFPYIISCFHGGNVRRQGQNMPSAPPDDNGQQPPPRQGGGAGGGAGVPAGLENDPCWNAKYRDWDSRICHVVCKNAGQDLEDCQTKVTDAGTTVFNATWTVYILTLTFIIYVSL
ncbi:uncharacterized protein LOC123540376 [Mercenaria mercenaria]|uniref:uncharacterized protein LOC123540376 n=1 Tax=Mercenaria mercenaria TaxID=6596 RepID=UPI00234F9465|nr:uncharacterized protein LOC123540376 [Mercenaria mercenaria]